MNPAATATDNDLHSPPYCTKFVQNLSAIRYALG